MFGSIDTMHQLPWEKIELLLTIRFQMWLPIIWAEGITFTSICHFCSPTMSTFSQPLSNLPMLVVEAWNNSFSSLQWKRANSPKSHHKSHHKALSDRPPSYAWASSLCTESSWICNCNTFCSRWSPIEMANINKPSCQHSHLMFKSNFQRNTT